MVSTSIYEVVEVAVLAMWGRLPLVLLLCTAMLVVRCRPRLVGMHTMLNAADAKLHVQFSHGPLLIPNSDLQHSSSLQLIRGSHKGVAF